MPQFTSRGFFNTGQRSPLGSMDSQALVNQGMAKFKRGEVGASITDFDEAAKVNPGVKPYLWQRGLSLYYVNKFEEGAKQFKLDVSVNPNDTEEAIWCMLCEARMESIGFQKAREQYLKVGEDSRKVMRVAYGVFGGSIEESNLKAFSEQTGNPKEKFYADLYLGLYAEAKGNHDDAKKYILMAVNSEYKVSDDYMWHLSSVHKTVRGW